MIMLGVSGCGPVRSSLLIIARESTHRFKSANVLRNEFAVAAPYRAAIAKTNPVNGINAYGPRPTEFSRHVRCNPTHFGGREGLTGVSLAGGLWAQTKGFL